jgi:hypothetical protein
MKPLLFSTACALSLCAAAACAPKPHAARAALDCPATQGDLTRTSIAADGKSCLYQTNAGDQVQLRLIPVSSTPQAALQPVEQELQAEVGPTTAAETPAPPAAPGAASGKAASKAASDAEAAAKEAREDSRQAEAEAKEAAADAEGEARGSEHTHVDLPGIHIDADDASDSAHVKVGMINIDAGDNGAVVRMSRDVRLRGHPFSREKQGFRATYILANDRLKDGYKAVGYQAGGPRTGPITVAVVKSRTGEHHGVFDDVQKLVRHNGGV